MFVTFQIHIFSQTLYLQRAFFIEPLEKFCVISSSDLELYLWVMHGNHCNISSFSSEIVDLQQVLICLICEKYHSASALVITYRVQAMTRGLWMFGKVRHVQAKSCLETPDVLTTRVVSIIWPASFYHFLFANTKKFSRFRYFSKTFSRKFLSHSIHSCNKLRPG